MSSRCQQVQQPPAFVSLKNVFNVCSIVWGVYGLYAHIFSPYGLEPRFWFSFVAFIAVGAGSVLFHATLWRSGQMLDELPMASCLRISTSLQSPHHSMARLPVVPAIGRTAE